MRSESCLASALSGFLGGIVFAAAAAGAAGPDEAVIVARMVTEPPVIDGRPDDPCWRLAETTRPFTVQAKASATQLGAWEAAEKKFAESAATAQICCDDQFLYAAVRCPAPADVPAAAKEAAPDGNVWRDDCIEFFVDPMRRMGFWQLAVNAIGTLADLEVPPGRGAARWQWQSQAKVATAPLGDGFAVEIALPFASLGEFPHTPGTVWGVNFTRQGKSGGGNSTWAPVGKDFHNVQNFGTLIFGGRKAFHQRELTRLEEQLAALAAGGDERLVADGRAMAA